MARKEKIVALWCVLFPCLLLLLGASATAAPVPFETLDKGEISYYRYSDSSFLGAEMTIRDAATWSSFWKKHKSGIEPAPRPPKVDFSEDMVVVVMLGYQPSGGGPAIAIKSVDDLISISNAVAKNYRITVVENETPGPLNIIANPYHIIRVKKANSVIFEHEAVQEAVTYRLTQESTYYQGCVSPCMCPVRIGGEIQGSFDLIETGADQWFKYYDVDQINWIVSNTSGQVLHKISGKGSYKVGGDFALTHELVLNLGIDSQPPAVFRSGLVPGGEEFPAIVITIDRGTACYDIWMDIVAKPIEP
jgi:hypothetical protein